MQLTRPLFVLLCLLVSLTPLGVSYINSGYYSVEVIVELLIASLVTAVAMTSGLIVVTPESKMNRWCRNVTSRGMAMRTGDFLLCGFVVFVGWTALEGWRAYAHYPVVIDSIAQYLHARIFAGGHVAVPSHPLRGYFALEHFIDNGTFYSQYPPGHIALLALGHLAGVPWLVNPLLGALTCVALYFLARDVFNEKVARITFLLAVLSPFMHAISSEFMNHATALFSLTLFSLCYVRAFKRQSLLYALAAGMAAGYCFITRPYSMVMYVLPFALYGAWLTFKQFRCYWRLPCMMALGFVTLALMQLLYNANTTGSPWLFGYILLYGPMHSPGFHAVPAHFMEQLQREQHTVWTGLQKGFNDLNLLEASLYNWPLPSLLFVAAAFLLRRTRFMPYLMLFLAACVGVWLADVTYFYGDWCFGPRYLYESAGLLTLLSAYGIAQTPLLLRLLPKVRLSYAQSRSYLTLLLGACMMWSLFSTNSIVTDAHYCWAPYPMVPQLQARHLKNALVFIRDISDANPRRVQSLAAYYYPPDDKNDVIVANDQGDKFNRALMDYYPDRTVYRWVFHQRPVRRDYLGWFFFGHDDDAVLYSQFIEIRAPKNH